MSAIVAVALREIRERRFLLATALVLGLLPFLFMVVPTLSPGTATDFRDVSAVIFSVSFTVAVALAVGGSIVSRELAEGRLGFYFARPISAASLWAGKFLGAIVLVVASTILVALPVAAVHGNLGVLGDNKVPFPLRVLAPGLFLLMGIAHVVACSYRSRSRLVMLDLVLAIAAIGAWATLFRWMVYAGAGPVFALAMPRMFGLAALVLMLGAGVQIAVGRSDRQRSHEAMSAGVWTLVGVFLLGCFLWGRSALDVRPTQLGGVGYGVQAAPLGGSSVVFMCDSTRPYSPVFILDGASGAYTRFSAERMSDPVFTRDGAALWLARRPMPVQGVLPTLAIARFPKEGPRIDEVDLADSWQDGSVLAVADDGGRVVLGSPSEVGLVDAASGGTLARSQGGAMGASFQPDGSLRLLQLSTERTGQTLFASAWDPRRGSRGEMWRDEGEGALLILARSRERAFAYRPAARSAVIIDLASGDHVRVDLGPTFDAKRGRPALGAALFLSDGSLAACLGRDLHLVGRGGTRVLALGEQTPCFALAESQPGELAVGYWDLIGRSRRTVFLDAATGTVRRTEQDLLPASGRAMSGADAPEAGSFASRLFIDQEGALLELRRDGTKRVVVAPPE